MSTIFTAVNFPIPPVSKHGLRWFAENSGPIPAVTKGFDSRAMLPTTPKSPANRGSEGMLP
jgi:hypothetical protein